MRAAESECIVRRILAIIWILLEEIFVQRVSFCRWVGDVDDER